MSFNPNDPEHYRECPLHQDFEVLEHTAECDKVTWSVGEWCSCGLDDIDYTYCYCDDIKFCRDYDAACEKGGV